MSKPAALWRRLRLRLDRSLVVIPCLYIVAAVVLGDVAPALDRGGTGVPGLDVDGDTARDILGATATGMIAFTGLVVASVLVVVQFAAGQYSPRLILWFRTDQFNKHAIGSFLAASLYALVALRELPKADSPISPELTVGIALLLLVAASVLFLALLERVMDHLRPRKVYSRLARAGIHAARAIYPEAVAGEDAPDQRAWAVAEPRVVRVASRPGIIVSFERDALVAAATRSGVVIELVPGVGEFVARGDALLRVHGELPIDDARLRTAVDTSDERTLHQDPAFAMRIIVDTAIRALSPAVNDPTTAVQALDVLELLVRELAGRNLEQSVGRGPDGAVRLVWHSPSWEDVLDLAFDEIRLYGASALQIARRLRAVLEDLRAATPPRRHPVLDAQLAALDAAVAAAFPAGSADLVAALRADRMGLGLARP